MNNKSGATEYPIDGHHPLYLLSVGSRFVVIYVPVHELLFKSPPTSKGVLMYMDV